MTAAKFFLGACLSFSAGIALASFFDFSVFASGFSIIFALAVIGVFWEKKRAVFAGFCLAFFVLGILRFQAAELEILRAKNSELSGRKISLIGRISAEPDKRPGYVNLKISVMGAEFPESGEAVRSLSGCAVLATVASYPEYFYGDKVKAEGVLRLPDKDGSFNWPGYLAKEGISWQIVRPEMEILERGTSGIAPKFFSGILALKERFRQTIGENMPAREASLLAGLLLGDRSMMSKEFKEEMNAAGLSHITAVSGMNVVILGSVLMSLLVGIGLWRQQAFWFVLIFIWTFVLLAGMPASAVRAGVMASLFLLAQFLGRQNAAWRAMFLAAAAMLAFNPFLLRYDVGFQLSFLAVAGLVWLEPIIRELLRFIPDGKFINLKEMLSQTLSAQTATLPVIIYNFGTVSLVSPLANILVLPAILPAMAFGSAFVLAGSVWPFLGWIASWPAAAILAYCVRATDFFSGLPFSRMALVLPVSWLFIFYIFLFMLVFSWRRKRRFLEDGYLS